jgi:cobalt-zinc-cadmium efflux system protein
MKTEKNILVAFILNLTFSIFEIIGGIFTGSVAIISDAVHDLGDAVSIGIAWFLEKKSRKQPNNRYTYGYLRYSVLGSLITTLILLLGSVGVIFNAVTRIITPKEIDYNGMILFGIMGVCVNFGAAFFTRGGNSLNQKAVNLHMLEDVLGWLVVLAGAVVMRLTNFAFIDSILSIGVALFILLHALKNLEQILNLFLAKTPTDVDISEIKEHLLELDGVLGVHHVHIWSMDNQNHYATMHIVTNADHQEVKKRVRRELWEHGIGHVVLELEQAGEYCGEETCRVEFCPPQKHHHP